MRTLILRRTVPRENHAMKLAQLPVILFWGRDPSYVKRRSTDSTSHRQTKL